VERNGMLIIYLENKVNSGITGPVIFTDKNQVIFNDLDLISVDIA
jgi:hypothetical protein